MQITIQVKGMTCGHCQEAVKEALVELEGVHGIEVHLDSGKVDVSYDDALVTKAMMTEAIENQGYDVIS
ncbi:copper chaperone CopZ [Sediminibacillus albus]|uniref:Copper chaperone CopZ n=1 Tax=Sediminibacillus albus TaxID=407036 RepID=A0A1G8YVZ1_9BACI|nr:copper chaperone CopZ [Sediminibacillus albus]SDK06943.1 copper chaperone [Sediminibacillus albus]